jgi:hypothetical protein
MANMSDMFLVDPEGVEPYKGPLPPSPTKYAGYAGMGARGRTMANRSRNPFAPPTHTSSSDHDAYSQSPTSAPWWSPTSKPPDWLSHGETSPTCGPGPEVEKDGGRAPPDWLPPTYNPTWKKGYDPYVY